MKFNKYQREKKQQEGPGIRIKHSMPTETYPCILTEGWNDETGAYVYLYSMEETEKEAAAWVREKLGESV